MILKAHCEGKLKLTHYGGYKRDNSGRPRVNYPNREVFKVRYVSRRERRMTRHHDAGNHRVPQFTGAPLLVSHCHQITCLLRCDRVKGSDPAFDFVDKGPFESLHQYRTSLRDRQDL